MIYTKLTFQFW